MAFNFSGKHIIVSGGTGALGQAVTKLLLEAGARCSIPCVDEDELEDVAFINHPEVFIKTGVNLTNESATKQFFNDAISQHGPLWGLAAIAGGFGMSAFGDTSADDFMKQIELNLLTCFNTCRQAVEQMSAGGRIVTMAARPALEPRQGAGMVPYATSKAGIAALTQALAEEIAEQGILVNAIAPSTIDTPANRKSMPEADFSQWPTPADIAQHIGYLLSAENTVTRGSIVTVYGNS